MRKYKPVDLDSLRESIKESLENFELDRTLDSQMYHIYQIPPNGGDLASATRELQDAWDKAVAKATNSGILHCPIIEKRCTCEVISHDPAFADLHAPDCPLFKMPERQ